MTVMQPGLLAGLMQAQPAAGNSFMPILLMVAMFAIFYFLLIRPQQKRMKEHQQMVNAVRRNDTVVTAGGIVGKVTKVSEGEDEIMVEISEGVKVKVIRGTLQDVRSKTDPKAAAKEAPKKK